MAPAHIIIVFLVVILTSLQSVSTLPAAFTLIGKLITITKEINLLRGQQRFPVLLQFYKLAFIHFLS
jgi:hypothetical protein